MQDGITLWGVGTPRTFRPLWALEELGVAYKLEPIGPRTGETQTEDFGARTAKRKVPLLEMDGLRLTESLAMTRHLIAFHPHENVWRPQASVERTREDEWCCHIYGELDETSLYVMRRHGELAEIYGEAPAAVAAAKAYAERHLAVIADMLDGRASVMDGFGLADIMLVSCLDWARFYRLDVPEGLLAYRRRIAERPAYQRAMRANYAAFPQVEQMIGG